jgi:hypothetical protein
MQNRDLHLELVITPPAAVVQFVLDLDILSLSFLTNFSKELAEGRIGSLTRVKSNRHQLELVWGSRIDRSVKGNSCGFARATGHSRGSWTSTRVEDQCKMTIKFEGVSESSCEDDGGRSSCQEGSEFHW